MHSIREVGNSVDNIHTDDDDDVSHCDDSDDNEGDNNKYNDYYELNDTYTHTYSTAQTSYSYVIYSPPPHTNTTLNRDLPFDAESKDLRSAMQAYGRVVFAVIVKGTPRLHYQW